MSIYSRSDLGGRDFGIVGIAAWGAYKLQSFQILAFKGQA